jgi:hypothetical protein
MVEIAQCGQMSIVLCRFVGYFCRCILAKAICTLTDLLREETVVKLLVEVPDHFDLDYGKLMAVLSFSAHETVVMKFRRKMPRCKELADISVSAKNAKTVALMAQDFGLEIPQITWMMIGEFSLDESEVVQYSRI